MKNKKVVFIVLCVILVLLLGIGIWSFISYSNKHKGYNTFDYEPTVVDPDSGEPYANDLMIFSGEEFVEQVKITYYDPEANVVLKDEKDSCFKATGPDGIKYSYCTGDPKISIEK